MPHPPLPRPPLPRPHSLAVTAQPQSSALFGQLGEVGDLQLELVDGIPSTALLLVSRVYHLPQLFNLLHSHK